MAARPAEAQPAAASTAAAPPLADVAALNLELVAARPSGTLQEA